MPDHFPRELRWIAPHADYLPGEEIERAVFGLDGMLIGSIAFTILNSPGSGFAGQVYRALPHRARMLPAIVAIKILRPRSPWKLWLRDALFRICFQTSFAPRLREEAVRSGLAWQIILRTAAAVELGNSTAVSCPYGYFWDPEMAAFAEIHEWVEGRPARSEPDENLFQHWLNPIASPLDNEMARKKRFMDDLASLCRRIGFTGLARQYDWWTCVSQANVVTRNSTGHLEIGESTDGIAQNQPEIFTAVDCRPGLAVPFFLPLSPAHARIIWAGLRRGVLVHYDEVNLERLSNFLSSQNSLANLAPLIERFKADDTAYRASLPDLWHTRLRILNEPAFRLNLRIATGADWLRLGSIDPQTCAKLPKQPANFYLLCLIGSFPWIGTILVRLLGNAYYRDHMRCLLFNPPYRTAALAAWRIRDLPSWQFSGRISTGHANILQSCLPAYVVEKLLVSWLPSPLHRVLVDPSEVLKHLQSVFLHPLRLLISQDARCTWLENILDVQLKRGLVSSERYFILHNQVCEPHMQGFIRDLGFTAGLDLFSRMVYLMLGIYAVKTGDFLPLGFAVLGPFPPSGPVRLIYVLTQLIIDLLPSRRQNQPIFRVLEAHIAALLIAPWRWLGNLFPLVEISTVYTHLSFLIAEYYTTRIVRVIPVFGGEGKLLQHAVFQGIYNIPLSLRAELDRIKTRKKIRIP